MSKEIVIVDGSYANPGDLSWDLLESFGSINVFERTNESQVINRCTSAEVIVTNKVHLGKEHFELLPNLKLIVISATGTDHIDIEAAKAYNIQVKSVKGYSTHSVAQHVFALIMALTNRVESHSQSVSNLEWNTSKGFSYTLNTITELNGKTLGIYGFGQIGQQVARIGHAYGMQPYIVSEHADPQDYPDYQFGSLESMFAIADFVSLHAPLTPQNEHCINMDLLATMKTSALLINTARGKLINEVDLKRALNENLIAGAAIDVLSKEPPNKSHPLIGLKNCIITPHLAWASKEARTTLINAIRDHISNFYQNPTN